jgi:hypothetical protein
LLRIFIQKNTFFREELERGPRLPRLPGPPLFSSWTWKSDPGNLAKKPRILMRPLRRCKKPVRTHYYVLQNRNLGVRTGWHSQDSFQKFLRNYQNWRGHITTVVRPRIPGVRLPGSTPGILRCGDTLVG